MDLKLLQALVTALFIGALVGTERTQHRRTEAVGFAGLRTFILFAELGAVLGWISKSHGSVLPFAAGLLCVAGFVGAAYVVERRNSGGSLGMTTEVVAVVTYALGGIAVMEHPVVAVALGIVTAALLATKKVLHQAVERISEAELLATLRLLFASFIVLPILPREPIDPWHVLSPYKLWLLVILISGLSMVGYVAVRLLGAARGVLVTGFFGGVVSSTALTLTFARQSRTEPKMDNTLAVGVLVAWTVMFLRVIVLVAMLRFDLLRLVLVPLLGLGLLNGLVVAVARWRARNEDADSQASAGASIKNPFRLLSAMKFALIFGLVLVASQLAQQAAPERGLYWVSALAGSTDVDAMVLSLAEIARAGSVPSLVLARSVLLASVANNLVKYGLIVALGSKKLAMALLPAAILLLVAGCLSIWVVG